MNRFFFKTITVLLACLVIVALGIAPLLSGCSSQDRDVSNVLFDFEHDSDLDRLSWKCGSLYSRSRGYQSSGEFALKVEMYPSARWPGFGFGVKDGWAGYRQLSLVVFNPAESAINMTCRIDDSRRNPPYEDRVNHRVTLKPGTNFLHFDLKQLRTSGTKRALRLEDVCCFLMFVHSPPERLTIFVDDIVLE